MRFGMKKIEIKTFFFFLIYNYLIFKNYDNFCTIIILQKKKKNWIDNTEFAWILKRNMAKK